MKKIDFNKYRRLGAYHWDLYKKNGHYRKHVARIKEWVEEKNVLDIGAGDGVITSYLKINGIDNDIDAVRIAKEKEANVILASAYSIPYKDEEFESALMIDVLEHMEYPEKALQEARRVIKDYLYIATPPKNLIPGKIDKYHYQEWTSDELKSLVENQGFNLEGEFLIVLNEKCIYGKFKKRPNNNISNE
jgi:ubiquinone/menaquinone biosynthesis C-methylase UbiE